MRLIFAVLSLLVVLVHTLHRPVVLIPGLGGSKLIAEFTSDVTIWEGTSGPMTHICGFDLTTLAGRVAELYPSVRFIDDGGGHLEANIYCRGWLLQMVPYPEPDGDFRVTYFANVTVPGFGGYGESGVTNFEVQMWLYGYVLGGNYRTAYWDWRLSPGLLDVQYGWMDSLQTLITDMVTEYGHPAVVVAHSSGNHPAHYFFAYYLDAEPDWKATNIHWYVSVANGLGGFSATLGCGAFVINAAVTPPAAPDEEFESIVMQLFLIGTSPFMIWSQPQTEAWEGIIPYYFEDVGGALYPESCDAWPFEMVLNATRVNTWAQASPSNNWIWPDEEFYTYSPGVNTSIICGYGLQTESTLVYETSEIVGLGLDSLQPTEFVVTPGVDGDNAIPEQICNCSHAWESDTSIEVETFRFRDIPHAMLIWTPEVVENWIFHAVESEPSGALTWGSFWSGMASGVFGRK